MSVKLTNRMAAIASLVRPGARLIDIGTDHAYLPIYLVGQGACTEAIAADVVDGPLARARENIEKERLGDRIAVRKSDGLTALEDCFADDTPTDVIIAGMGGELIRDILEAAPFAWKSYVRFHLQPMTMQAALRRYLCESGFAILGETLAEDRTSGVKEGRLYQILTACYTGEKAVLPEAEAVLGFRRLNSEHPLFEKHMARQLSVLDDKIAGMKRAGLDTAAEEELRREIEGSGRKPI